MELDKNLVAKLRKQPRPPCSWGWCCGLFLLFCFILFRYNFFGENSSPSDSEDQTVSVSIKEIMSGEAIQLEQDDPRIIKYIWENKLLEPPSSSSYNLANPNDKEPSRGQSQFVRKILNNMTNGFFIECGALDGETRSNTLYMERHLGWTGLLVEASPSNYEKMKKKNRKAWMSNTCLSIKPYPHQANFFQNFNLGKIANVGEQTGRKQTVQVQCLPVFTLLASLNVSTVDYFSLDVEGSELQVLKTIPFDKIFIKTLSVEFIHTEEGKEMILKFMESNGYRMAGEVHYPGGQANDFIFVHKLVKDASV